MDTQLARSIPRPACRPSLPVRSALLLLAAAVGLAGCASGGGLGKAVNRTLESVGMREVDHDARAGIRTVPLRLYAGENLNSGNGGRASATVVKIYHLRGTQRFNQATFNALMDDGHGETALGNELVQAREIVLTPGMRREFEERVSAETTHVGVVALFRAPASERWRYAFDVRHDDAVREGITVGLHACALTTGSATLATSVSGDASSLVSTHCSQ